VARRLLAALAMRSFPCRAAALALSTLLVSILLGGVGGCSSQKQEPACFPWPAGQACPGEDIAVLYLGKSVPSCGGLDSIDTPGAYQDGMGCCYTITVTVSQDCQPLG
jgi:hypothetical protein